MRCSIGRCLVALEPEVPERDCRCLLSRFHIDECSRVLTDVHRFTACAGFGPLAWNEGRYHTDSVAATAESLGQVGPDAVPLADIASYQNSL